MLGAPPAGTVAGLLVSDLNLDALILLPSSEMIEIRQSSADLLRPELGALRSDVPEKLANLDLTSSCRIACATHSQPSERGFEMRAKLVAAVCAAVFCALSASAALAGEVQGPPGTPGVPFSGSGQRTGAPAHASSICAYNGLNDMNPDQGPIDSIVQTPHNQGTPGEAGAGPGGSGVPGSPTCGRGTNPELP